MDITSETLAVLTFVFQWDYYLEKPS